MAALAAADTLFGRVGDWRLVDYLRVGAILSMALVLSLRSTSALSFAARDHVLDDELTRANRASAACWGFWALMGSLVIVLAASFVVQLRLSEMVLLVVVIGAASAGLRFIQLERRGE